MYSKLSIHRNSSIKYFINKIKYKFESLKFLKQKRRPIKIRWNEIIKETFIEFCKGTSLHGFRQIVDLKHDAGNSKITKIFQIFSIIVWSLMVLIGFGLGIFLVIIVLLRYSISPTITTIDSTNFPVSDLPFPGVAICDINTVYKPQTQNITNLLLSKQFPEDKIKRFFENLQSLVTSDLIQEDFTTIFNTLIDAGLNSNELMKTLAKPCSKLLYKCSWLAKPIDCEAIFRMDKTELGYCCVFNYHSGSENGTMNQSVSINWKDEKIVHSASVGEDIGLRVYINIESSMYISPRKYIIGAEVMIFDPIDYPQQNFIASLCQPGKEIALTVKPATVGTAPEVQSMSTNLRSCLFDNERKLLVSLEYTFQSCITECRAIEMLKICNCLPFFYPTVDYLRNNMSYRVCTFQDITCLNENEVRFFSLKSTGFPSTEEENSTVVGLDCDCLQSCGSVSYTTDTFYMNRFTDMNLARYKTISDMGNHSHTQLSLLKIYYKELSCMKYARSIFMTWDNLLANIGGIFGLCLGGSVISLIEILYYFTLKFYEKFLKHKNELNKEAEVQKLLRNIYRITESDVRALPQYGKNSLNHIFDYKSNDNKLKKFY